MRFFLFFLRDYSRNWDMRLLSRSQYDCIQGNLQVPLEPPILLLALITQNKKNFNSLIFEKYFKILLKIGQSHINIIYRRMDKKRYIRSWRLGDKRTQDQRR